MVKLQAKAIQYIFKFTGANESVHCRLSNGFARRSLARGQRSANCRTYRLDMGQWNPRGTKKKRARAAYRALLDY